MSPNGDLYVYGGHDVSQFCGGLYKLSSLKWSQISAESDPLGPMKKSNCGMVCISSDKIAVIGGFGLSHGPLQPGASFTKDKRSADGRGWTNEIHVFDTKESEYCAQCDNSHILLLLCAVL